MAKYKNQKKRQQQRKQEKQKELEAQGITDEPKVSKKIKPEFYSNLQNQPQDYFVNPMFENFYKLVLKDEFKDEEEFKNFWAILKEKLPVTFRISKNIPNYENYQKKLLKGKDYIKECVEESQKFLEEKQKKLEEKKQDIPEQHQIRNQSHFQIEDIDSVNLFPVSYFPGNLTYQLDVNKCQLRKGGVLKAFHSELQKACDSGIATRQELVSMFPPVLLDPQPSDKIFDMCAAPGSKTSQLLDIMASKCDNPNGVTGCVIANDVDTNRAYMLTHQIDRNSTSGMMVVNHQAQFFPQLYLPQEQQDQENKQKKQKFLFDKVLADVPCTGDGAVRKITKKFQDWNTREGFALFPIQLSILMRAIQVCKVGGLIMYSTCSINPIEDEAVVTEALRRALPNSLELLDCHERLPGFKGRKGLYNWPVIVSKLKKRNLTDKTVEELNNLSNEEMFKEVKLEELGNIDKQLKAGDSQYSLIKKDMFPESEEVMKKWGMEKTMRIMPHDQNTGGFYLCLIRKKASKVFLPNHVFDPAKINEPVPEQYLNENQEQADQDAELDQEAIKEVDDKAEVENFLQSEKLRVVRDQQKLKEQQEKMELEGEQQIQQQDDKNPQEQTREEIRKKKQEQKMEEKFEDFEDITESEFQQIEQDYGLQNFPRHLLQVGKKGQQKNVRLVTPSVYTIIKSDVKRSMNLVNCGTRVFRRETEKEGQFKYRLCNDGIKEVFPYMTKRKMKISVQQLKQIISKGNITFNSIEDKQFVKQLEQFGSGSCAFYIEQENGVIDCFVAQIFKTSVQVMMSKEAIRGYDVIYNLQIQ